VDSNFEKLLKVITSFKVAAQSDLELKDGVPLSRAQGAMSVLKDLESRAELIVKGEHEEVFGDDEN